MNKICSVCNETKDKSEFYIVGKTKKGVDRFNPKCKTCVLEYNRRKYNENESYRKKRKESAKALMEDPIKKAMAIERSINFYKSVSGRAKTLYKGAKRRASVYDEFDVSVEWIEKKLERGYCELTRLPFDFLPHPKYAKNPYSPSIDRIDSTKGYTKENVRIVLWQVNLMRGEMTDEEVELICKKFIERNKLNE